MHRISAAQAPDNALVGWQRAWRLASRCVSARRLDETPCKTAGLNAGERRAQPRTTRTWCARRYLWLGDLMASGNLLSLGAAMPESHLLNLARRWGGKVRIKAATTCRFYRKRHH